LQPIQASNIAWNSVAPQQRCNPSFARFLKKKKLLKRNIVRDVEGEEFGEGDPRGKWLDAAVAKHVHDCIPAGEVEKRCAYALATGAAAEKNALKKMRVRDVTIVRNKRGAVESVTVWVDGGKNRWRRRHVRIVRSRKDKSELVAWCIPSIEAAMKNKLPDALLCASAVRTDRKMLRCIRKASRRRRSSA
jgi:hypothetical protein